MKKHQHGAITLLITSVLLLCALILTLGSYRSIFYQIKRAQNEVVARQQHWQAEGGLECAFTKVYQDKDMTQLTAAALCRLLLYPMLVTFKLTSNHIYTGYCR